MLLTRVNEVAFVVEEDQCLQQWLDHAAHELVGLGMGRPQFENLAGVPPEWLVDEADMLLPSLYARKDEGFNERAHMRCARMLRTPADRIDAAVIGDFLVAARMFTISTLDADLDCNIFAGAELSRQSVSQ